MNVSTAPAYRVAPTGPQILLAILVLNVAVLIGYITFGYRLVINSDAAMKLVLAEEIRRTGSFFPSDFYFGLDLWLLHGHLIVLAVAPFLGTGYAAHAASGLVLLAVLLFSFRSLLRRLDLSTPVIVIAFVVITTGFSDEWAEHMYGQGSYGYVCLLLTWAMIAVHDAFIAKRSSVRVMAALAAVAILVGWYGVRGLVTYVVPLSAGLLAAAPGRLPRRSVLVCAVAFLTGLVLRIAVQSQLAPPFLSPTFNAIVGLGGADVVHAIVWLFGLVPVSPVPYTVAAAAVYALRAATVGIVSLGSAAAIALLITRRASAAARYVIVTHIVLVAGTLYSMFMVSELRGRGWYLVPGVFTGIVAGAAAMQEWRQRIRPFILVTAGGALLALSWTTCIQPAVRAAIARGFHQMHPLSPVARFLEQRGIDHGYATFGYAAVMTALSPRVRLGAVWVDDGVPRPRRELSAEHFYGENQERTALVLEQAIEAPLFEQAVAAGRITPADRVATVANFRIYEYDRNVFAELPRWRREHFASGFGKELVLTPQELSHEAIATMSQDGRRVTASGGDAGYLVYGPYIALAPGRYTATFDVEASDSCQVPCGTWDIALGVGQQVLTSGTIAHRGRQQIVATFEIGKRQRRQPFETRVHFGGRGTLACYGVMLRREVS